ncbi:hypothetical protein NQ317_009348 [Molorchus minor]|uniref:Uncharacterized protein n=1 Tax=Molorchus minor TaxID=1323400 RepID=A0ABQ9JNH1_9CUCU|nr:hypothetical protein NQ317_009348 [Molorchus minor]
MTGILKRNRSEEKAISFDYIKDLHDIHEDWLYYKKLHICPASPGIMWIPEPEGEQEPLTIHAFSPRRNTIG